MSFLTTRTARTMIYFGCIGGLLVFNSFIVLFLWNTITPSIAPTTYNLSPITFLEGSGITAFAYVIAFSVRYGLQQKRQAKQKENLKERCSALTTEQREALKHELVTSCGCKEAPPPSRVESIPVK